jgi:hypothetical protein
MAVLAAELGRSGNREVDAQLISEVYGELRRLASLHMRAGGGEQTLQLTALVNGDYTRLFQQPQNPRQSGAHFFAVASQLTRHIHLDHALQADERGGVQCQGIPGEVVLRSEDGTIGVLVLPGVLEHLAQCFNVEEIAVALHVSDRTVERYWSMARLWLQGEL